MAVGDLDTKIQKMLPGYHTMGTKGTMPMSPNQMQFPQIVSLCLVMRDSLDRRFFGGGDGQCVNRLYYFPEGSVVALATEEELKRDGVVIDEEQNLNCRC